MWGTRRNNGNGNGGNRGGGPFQPNAGRRQGLLAHPILHFPIVEKSPRDFHPSIRDRVTIKTWYTTDKDGGGSRSYPARRQGFLARPRMITGGRVPGGDSWVRNQAVYSSERGARDRQFFDDSRWQLGSGTRTTGTQSSLSQPNPRDPCRLCGRDHALNECSFRDENPQGNYAAGGRTNPFQSRPAKR